MNNLPTRAPVRAQSSRAGGAPGGGRGGGPRGGLTQQERMRERRESSRDVGRHEPTSRIRLKRRYREDLAGFVVRFFPRAVPLRMSGKHREFLEQLSDAILHGGRVAVALPRGYGKTTLIVLATLWAILYGHRRYVTVIAATQGDARKIIRTFKTRLERTDLLNEVFPEVCHYVRALGGQSQRATGQLADGEQTGISWTTDMLVTAHFERNDRFLESASQAVIEARGMTGSIRGLQYTTLEGETLRPDFIILDDPQTRESAHSEEQTAARVELINGDILGCAGPTVKIAAVMACTVICEGDLSEHFLESWTSTRAVMVERWPENAQLWDRYMALFEELKGEPELVRRRELNAFYRANRKAMDAGAVMSWPERVMDGDLSALQGAYNLRCDRGDAAFYAEFQNQPLKLNTSLYTLTAKTVLSRTNGLAHRATPDDAPLLVCAADVNYYAISFVVVAFRSDFTAFVVDYGWFPEGGVYDAKRSDVPEGTAIYEALSQFCELIKTTHPRLQILGIDGNRFTSPVNKFAAFSANRQPFRVVPLRGVAAKHYREPTRQTPGLYGAPRLRCCMRVNAERILYAPFDSHYWHMFQQRMWLLSPGAPGSASLFTDAGINHRRFAEQLTADKLRDFYERNGELVYDWSTIGQNEMSDAMTMATVLANLAGIDPVTPGVTMQQNGPVAVMKRRRRKM
ncbi:terminase gpA endonuclease subunit [uncultured Victivallis sp.]|uniref:terminase gpA endonuclease subunit n=1 Tax=uncultured Victivallis sp. TaxID=354118 RepID=UPI0025E23E27|nr:terminase gpA endonuclease subunit [uncultured Victivallis sp.]